MFLTERVKQVSYKATKTLREAPPQLVLDTTYQEGKT